MLQGEFGLVGATSSTVGTTKITAKMARIPAEITVPDRPHPTSRREFFPQIRVGNPAIPDVEPLQDLQNADAADGGDQHYHGDDSAPVEVGDPAQHLVIEQGWQ